MASAWLLLTALSAHSAIAQPTTPAGAAPAATAPIALQTPPNPVLQVPKQIELKLVGLPEPSSGPGWMGSLVIGAILAALSSIATTLIGAEKRRELEVDLQRSLHSHELDIARLSREHSNELKALEQAFQKDLKRAEFQHQHSTHSASLSREDQKIETERRRLKQQTDASDLEIEIAVARMARDYEADVAKLIHLFFDKLTSEQAVHRELALQALGEFVDVDAVRRTLDSAHKAAGASPLAAPESAGGSP